MKKQLFLASALTFALTSQAQILTPTKTTSDGVGQPIPGMFTCDGKSRMTNYTDYGEQKIRIYNENLEVEKEFEFVQPNIGRYSVTKQRELVWKNMPEKDWILDNTGRPGIDSIGPGINDMKDMTVDNIRRLVGSHKWVIVTETSRTATSVSINIDVNKDSLEYEMFDPVLDRWVVTNYVTGTITFSLNADNPRYATLSGTLKFYSPSYTGDWKEVRKSDVQYDGYRTFLLSYHDMTSLFDDNSFITTQSLFKKDEAYEYIVPICQQIIERTDNSDRDEDGEVDQVVTEYGISYSGFKIMQDNGNVLATIKFDGGYSFSTYSWREALNFLHFENKDYIAAYVQKKNNNGETEDATIFYAITPGDATSIKAVHTEYNGVKATPALAHKNETVVVDFSGIENAKQLSVVNGNGRTVMQTHVTNGQTSYTLNTSNLPAGLYVVKVDNGKHTTETCKIVVR